METSFKQLRRQRRGDGRKRLIQGAWAAGSCLTARSACGSARMARRAQSDHQAPISSKNVPAMVLKTARLRSQAPRQRRQAAGLSGPDFMASEINSAIE